MNVIELLQIIACDSSKKAFITIINLIIGWDFVFMTFVVVVVFVRLQN